MADSKALVERFTKDIDTNHDVAVADRFLTADCAVTTPMGSFKGPEEFKAFLEVFFTALPDVRHDLKVTSSGNTAKAEATVTGTHKGPFQTPQGAVPPTGKVISFRDVADFEIEGDKFSSINIDFDPAEIMAQIGAS
jgi:predicted ester cyclase